MKPCLLAFFLSLTLIFPSNAQTEKTMDAENDPVLPYFQIPDYPKIYTSATVAARMIDGLGFRYYWATEGLGEEDLNFKPGDDARTTEATLSHIYDLSVLIVNAVNNQPNIIPAEVPGFVFEQLRAKTLENFKQASDILKADPQKDLSACQVIFKRDETTAEFPFWNLINGPVADAIWHVGQVVSFRRSSGNPLNPRANVFTGQPGE